MCRKKFYEHFGEAAKRGAEIEAIWDELVEAYCNEYKKDGETLKMFMKNELPADWEDSLPKFEDTKAAATRAYSGEVINAIAGALPQLDRRFGGFGGFKQNRHQIFARFRAVGLRRTNHSFRRARTRDGFDDERNGTLRKSDPVRRHIFNFQRLYAPRDSPRRTLRKSRRFTFSHTIQSA